MDRTGIHIRESATFEAIDIFLFTNGQQYSPPRKHHLSVDELTSWETTLKHLARLQYGALQSKIELFTLNGVKISSPLELVRGGAYVAVVPPDPFIDTGYHRYLIRASRSWEKRQLRRTQLLQLQGTSENIETPKINIKETNEQSDGQPTNSDNSQEKRCKKPYKCTKPYECRKNLNTNPKNNIAKSQSNNTKIPLISKGSPTKRKINISKVETRSRPNGGNPHRTITTHMLKYGKNVPTISGTIKIRKDIFPNVKGSVTKISGSNNKEVSNNTEKENSIKEESFIKSEKLNDNIYCCTCPSNEKEQEQKDNTSKIKVTTSSTIKEDVADIIFISNEKTNTDKQYNEIIDELNKALDHITTENKINRNGITENNNADNNTTENKIYRNDITENNKTDHITTANKINRNCIAENNYTDNNTTENKINRNGITENNTTDNNTTENKNNGQFLNSVDLTESKNKVTISEIENHHKSFSCDSICHLLFAQKDDDIKQSTHSMFTNQREKRNSILFETDEKNLYSDSEKFKIIYGIEESHKSARKKDIDNNDKDGYLSNQHNASTDYDIILDENQSKNIIVKNNQSQTSQKLLNRDSFDKFSTFMNKGDVLNVKLTIEVRNKTNSVNHSGDIKVEKHSQADLSLGRNQLNDTNVITQQNTFLLDTTDGNQLNKKKLIIVQCSCSHDSTVNNMISLTNAQNSKGSNKKILFLPQEIAQDISCKCGVISPSEKLNNNLNTESATRNIKKEINNMSVPMDMVNSELTAKRKESLRVQEMVATLEQNMKTQNTDLHDDKKKTSTSVVDNSIKCRCKPELANDVTERRTSNFEEITQESPNTAVTSISIQNIEVLSVRETGNKKDLEPIKNEIEQRSENNVTTTQCVIRHSSSPDIKPEINFNAENRLKNKNKEETSLYNDNDKSDTFFKCIDSCIKEKLESVDKNYAETFSEKSTQTDWRASILEARIQRDGHYHLYFPSIETLRLYNLC